MRVFEKDTGTEVVTDNQPGNVNTTTGEPIPFDPR